MGMDIILQQGLKSFFNKFKRKGDHLDHYASPPEAPARPCLGTEIGGSDRELIFLLSEMIQAAGTYHGTE